MKKLRGMLWKPGVNGLGVRGMHCLPYRRRFDAAARKHDAEYDEKGGGKDRREYDIIFLQSMLEVCETTLQVSVAVVYFYAVRLFGWMFYRYTRTAACKPPHRTKGNENGTKE